MRIIEADCVDKALFRGLTLLTNQGLRSGSRNGDVLVMPCPVMTVNHRPWQRVSFSSKRNANPFFHLMEAFWMLAGRNDVTWLDQFVGDFSQRFGESVSIQEHPSGLLQHGAYGFRWRQHFDIEGGGGGWPPDQLNKVVEMLRKNPDDRRAVIAMWDPVADLGADKKDIPCNTHIYPRIRTVGRRKQGVYLDQGDMSDIVDRELDLTVCCRSNDAVMGCHGANAVHFSILQEYLAARIGVGMGKLYQMSNNYHVYDNDLKRVWPMGLKGMAWYDRQVQVLPLVTNAEEFDTDLAIFFGVDWELSTRYANSFFHRVAVPMRVAYAHWRDKQYGPARGVLAGSVYCDWTVAAYDWFDRRMHKHLEKEQPDVSK